MALIVGVAKFALGAWMILLLIPLLIAVMWAIERHYRGVERALAVTPEERLPAVRDPLVIVPISRLDRAALAAVAYARSISSEVNGRND